MVFIKKYEQIPGRKWTKTFSNEHIACQSKGKRKNIKRFRFFLYSLLTRLKPTMLLLNCKCEILPHNVMSDNILYCSVA